MLTKYFFENADAQAINKNKLYIFGGFYDALTTTQYYNDLYVIDLDAVKAQKIIYKQFELSPPPRSGCSMAIYDNHLFLYGGYSKLKEKNGVLDKAKGRS